MTPTPDNAASEPMKEELNPISVALTDEIADILMPYKISKEQADEIERTIFDAIRETIELQRVQHAKEKQELERLVDAYNEQRIRELVASKEELDRLKAELYVTQDERDAWRDLELASREELTTANRALEEAKSVIQRWTKNQSHYEARGNNDSDPTYSAMAMTLQGCIEDMQQALSSLPQEQKEKE